MLLNKYFIRYKSDEDADNIILQRKQEHYIDVEVYLRSRSVH